MLHVALGIHLGFLPIRRRRERHHPKNPRAHPLGERLDHPPLAGAVTPFENDTDLEPLELDPLLKLDQFHVQLRQLLLVCLGFEFQTRLA